MKDLFKRYYDLILGDIGSLLNSAAYILVVLISVAIAWWVFNVIIGKVEKRYSDRPFFERNRLIFVFIKRAGHYSILILGGIALLNLFHLPIMERIFYAFMIILLSSIANSIVNSLLPYMERHVVTKTETQVDDVIISFSKKFSSIIIYTTGGILALDVLGLNIIPFVAGAGVITIAVGFAAKDTLSNLISGIIMIVDRPIEVGDRIEVWSAPKNSSTWGDVIHIGLRATKIQTTDNILIVIPNNEIMNRDIINYTAITKRIRVRVPIGIAYDADVKKAKEIICKIALELDWVLREPAPVVVVRSFGDSAVNLEARVWIGEPRRRVDTISHVMDRVKEAFQQEGIEIPYPKRDIYIKKEEVL